ncbi:MAG: hypothetical protein DWQ44_01150 [Bacteroidetes bacterium]|nr:MAG: hypothetical protein DWQ33_00615 [Bacteroidota bacterium]REK04975.1 MAG: hypothetical protein DWQ39_07105 [Bacteroidota bacterium]REK36521.1 MAG: hypothetical protein DWQ44_01150 [Bacteroidota bacterium]REK50887.1 MAG: hypothetical protein DWQ48_02010 [Bacteroidota bacterium]
MNEKRYVILADKSGQLANQIVRLSHFIAHSAEHKYILYNTSFQPLLQYFVIPKSEEYAHIRLKHSSNKKLNAFLFKIVRKSSSVLQKISRKSPWHECISTYKLEVNATHLDFYDLEGSEFLTLLETKKYLILKGWKYRSRKLLPKHRELIKNFFHLAHPFARNVKQKIDEGRNESDLLIGVHIRRGDYAFFEGGKYFYQDDVYRRCMEDAQRLFANKKIKFLICSNEAVNPVSFTGLDFVNGTGHFVEDLYSLAGCDYIIGPPSTYSMWASFYGNVPFRMIRASDDQINLEDFHVFTI